MKPARPSPRTRLPSPAGDLAIGVMGGSFDPPHGGHAHVIRTAQRALGLDRVWVFVAAGNPLKKTQTPFARRFEMAQERLAARRTHISALEEELGLTYTIDLLKHLKRTAPQARFVWIMGADNLRDFHRWRRWREIAALVPVAVIARPGAMPKAGLSRFARQFAGRRTPEEAARRLPFLSPPAWVYITAPLNPLSSTEIRKAEPIVPPPI